MKFFKCVKCGSYDITLDGVEIEKKNKIIGMEFPIHISCMNCLWHEVILES